jgi:hypothetical protein
VQYWYKDGRFLDMPHYVVDKNANVFNATTGKRLSTNKTAGKNAVGLRLDGKAYSLQLSRLVLSSWEGEPKKGDEADHVDPARYDDDSLANLQWLSKKENHAKRRKFTKQSASPVLRWNADGTQTRFRTVTEAAAGDGVETAANIRRACINNAKLEHPKHMTGGYIFTWDDTGRTTEELDGEEWTPAKRRDGSAYAVTRVWLSNFGRVKDARRNLHILAAKDYLSELQNEMGVYPTISIEGEARQLHELFCTSYHGPNPDPANLVCCHRNDDKLDPRPSNVYWGTRSQNNKDARANGKYDGTESEAVKVTIEGLTFPSMQEAADRIGFPYRTMLLRVQKHGTTLDRSHFARKVFVVDGQDFKTATAARDFLGIGYMAFNARVKDGTYTTKVQYPAYFNL